MIGLDTNVFIRYIVQDDEQQAQLATDVIENQCSVENPAFINEITLCEIVWVEKVASNFGIFRRLIKSCSLFEVIINAK